MGSDRIDASIGLALSLALFERYRRNGLLQAELHHVPGFRGRCRGCLHLVEGKVVSCFIEDKHGQRNLVGAEMLCQLDRERGPFEWTLTPLPVPPVVPPKVEGSPPPVQSVPIPRRVAALNLEKLDGWTYRQKLTLSIVFDVIDGRRTIEEIKMDTPLPPAVVEEAVRVLLALKVIVFSS